MRKSDKIQGGFVAFPKATLRDKRFVALSTKARVVYWGLLTELIRDSKKNPKWKVLITQLQLSKLTGISRKTVGLAIKELKEAGFIEVPPEDQGGLERRPTTYTLVSKWLQ